MGKSDDDKDKKADDKKEEVEKTEDEDDKKEDVKKSDSSEYEIVKTVRPLLKSRGEEETTIPTGYQILKAISSGWNGQTSSAEDALVIAYNKLEAGEFGNGLPGGY